MKGTEEDVPGRLEKADTFNSGGLVDDQMRIRVAGHHGKISIAHPAFTDRPAAGKDDRFDRS